MEFKKKKELDMHSGLFLACFNLQVVFDTINGTVYNDWRIGALLCRGSSFHQNTSIHSGKEWHIGPEVPDWLMLQGLVFSHIMYNICGIMSALIVFNFTLILHDGLFIQIFCWYRCFLWTDFNYLWGSSFAIQDTSA